MDKRTQKFFSHISNVRNLLIFKLIYYTGLNLSQVLNIKITNLDLNSNQLTQHIRNTEYKIKLPLEIIQLIQKYVAKNKYLLKNYLFLNPETGKPVSRQFIHATFQKYCSEAKLSIKLRDLRLGDMNEMLNKQQAIYNQLSTNVIQRNMDDKEFRNGKWRESHYQRLFKLIPLNF